jgi:hypothetical protein
MPQIIGLFAIDPYSPRQDRKGDREPFVTLTINIVGLSFPTTKEIYYDIG